MNEKIRLAQIFDIEGSYIPTKASIFLRKSGENSGDSFILSDSVVIDATNFSNIKQGTTKIFLNDEDNEFTGNGYMSLQNFLDADDREYPILEYPIKSQVEGIIYLWLRVSGSATGRYVIDILIDGVVVETIDQAVSWGEGWFWLNTEIMLPDKKKHILGISLREVNNKIDKIILNVDTGSGYDPVGVGPSNSISPFFTVHLQLYKVNSDFDILFPFSVYDFKNSIDEVIQTDWYNFDIRGWDTGTDSNLDYTEKAALVLSTSGTWENNFVVWELVDNDEYMALPSGLKI